MNVNWRKVAITGGTVLAALFVGAYLGLWQWMICRREVPPGQSLLLRYKGPWPFGGVAQAPEGTLVSVDKWGRPERVGILEVMPGPGRHFYSPLEYEIEYVPDIVIKPGEIGLVTAKVGKDLPAGTFVADEGYKGVQRKLLTPGRYRINKYAYQVEEVSITACVGSGGGVVHEKESTALIPPGYVGVVTNKQPRPGEMAGIQPDVLQPGIYYINPYEKRLDIVSIGFNETSLQVEVAKDQNGRPRMAPRQETPGADQAGIRVPPDPIYLEGKGIHFPSADAFDIHMDFTAIWGIMPEQAPDVVRQFGELKDVDQKVILPQIMGICRVQGSKRGAVDLLVGDTREAFQTDTAEELDRVLASKDLKLLFGLTRHIYVPAQVREPIQQGKIAEELKKTREQEQLTQKAAADLAEAKQKVLYEERRTEVETEKTVAETKAEGTKKAAEIAAQTEKLTAKIEAETAQIQAQITKTTREAAAKKVELSSQAKAELSRLQVQALGGPDAYNRYMFAEKLPSDLRLGVFYAGPGTFWTDLKGFEQILTGKLVSDQATPAPTAAAPAPVRAVDRR
jgi:hypothetical protein